MGWGTDLSYGTRTRNYGYREGRGNKVKKFKIGDQVDVGCFVDSCRTCPECRQGLEQYCAVLTSWTYNGQEQHQTTPTFDGYSGRIVVDENYPPARSR
jgi:uncharacterized zinc-type alcohol dehydrogenase-like protein